MKRIFIIGSLSQVNELKEIADVLRKDFDVTYVHPRPNDTIDVIIHDAFDEIEKCNHVVALRKPDKSFGRGTLYEIEFAKRIHKPITFVNSQNTLEKPTETAI